MLSIIIINDNPDLSEDRAQPLGTIPNHFCSTKRLLPEHRDRVLKLVTTITTYETAQKLTTL